MEGPWSINGHFISCCFSEAGFKASSVEVHITPAWVTLPELPVELGCKKILEHIVNAVGKFIALDKRNPQLARKEARVLVQLNVRENIPPSVWIDYYKIGIRRWQNNDDLGKTAILSGTLVFL